MAATAESLVRKTVTVLFCDVTGFTSLGERVDPETMRRVMLRYFDEMRAVLERHGGTVEKFIGDAVMAVFGVPVLHEDDALRAVMAADEMRTRLGELNEELEAGWGLRLEARIGVNTGEVVVGDPALGSTITTGDAVNVAARLQQAAEPGQTLLGRETYNLVSHAISAGPLEAFSLRGRAGEVRPWRLDEVRAGADRVFRRLGAPLVGREPEQDVLHALYRETLEEQAIRVVTVVGAAGIGKTRLAQEVCARLFGATVAQGRCLPYGDGITFFPVLEIVRSLAGAGRSDGEAQLRDKLAALLPASDEAALVAERVAGLLAASSEGRAEESFWALRRLFESAARTRPLVLVVEDAHWAESTLLDLVEYLAGWSRGAPILVLCLTRPDLLDARPSWPGERLWLEPLPAEDVRELLGNVLGSGVLDDEVERRIAVAAEGNPLFVEELARMLVDEGSLAFSNGRWHATAPIDALAIPPSINALLAARLDRLVPAERSILQCASVVGKQFWWSAVTELAPPELREDVGTHLHSLVRKRLVLPADATAFEGEDTFRFGHILVRDAAYATLPKEQRAQLHALFATWLEQRGAPEEIRGHHLEQAYLARSDLGPVDDDARALAERAGALLGTAGRRAFAREDMAAAARLLTRATALLPPGAERREAERELSAALWVVGEHERAGEILEAVLESARADGDRRTEWSARLEQLGRLHASGEIGAEELDRAAREAAQVFEELGDELGVAKAWRRIAYAARSRCAFTEATAASERALAHVRKVGDLQEETRIVDGLCTALLFGPTRVDAALARCREILDGAPEHSLYEANVVTALAGLYALAGDFPSARASYRRARSIYEELGLPLLVGALSGLTGVIELLARNPQAAEAELREGLDLLTAAGYRATAAVRTSLLALALLAQDRAAEAQGLLDGARAALAPGDVMAQVIWRGAAARLRGDPELAREAVALADGTDALNLQADARSALADVLAAHGGDAEAAAERRRAASLYAQKGNVVGAPIKVPATAPV